MLGMFFGIASTVVHFEGGPPIAMVGFLILVLTGISARIANNTASEILKEASSAGMERRRQDHTSLAAVKQNLEELTRELIKESLSRDPSFLKLERDYFLSHASEDKKDFVQPLHDALTALGVRVFYDREDLRPGDSLRRGIDMGLSRCRYAIVVLSPSYIEKAWTNLEMDGLVTLQLAGRTRIIPIWHRVTKNDVLNYSPTLADKVALNSSLLSVKEIASELTRLLDR
jgi:hypothetical protein